MGGEGPSGGWIVQARGSVGGTGLGGGMDRLWVGAARLGIDPELSRGSISRSDSNQRSGPRTTCVLGPKDENEATGKDELGEKV